VSWGFVGHACAARTLLVGMIWEGELPPDERAALVRAAWRELSARLNAAKVRKRRRRDVPRYELGDDSDSIRHGFRPERQPLMPVNRLSDTWSRQRGDSAIMAAMRANQRPPYGGETPSWEQVAQLPGMDVSAIDLATLRQAVAVACMFTATDEEDALELLRRVPGLAEAPEWEVLNVALWVRRWYPAEKAAQPSGGDRWWETPQPDPLVEAHVVTELAHSRQFAWQCMHGLTARQATEALAILARACAHQQQAPAFVGAVLRASVTGPQAPAAGSAT
jgi:hypothetical protein